MANYANQKTIVVTREIPEFNGKRQFLTAYTDNIAQASRTLNGEVSFKLYLYLLSNKDGYTVDYSPQHFANIYGVSAESAKNARKKLEDAGYLVADEKHPHRFTFYETPREKELALEIEFPEEEKRLAPCGEGVFRPITYSQLYTLYKDKKSEEVIKQVWNDLEVCTYA